MNDSRRRLYSEKITYEKRSWAYFPTLSKTEAEEPLSIGRRVTVKIASMDGQGILLRSIKLDESKIIELLSF